MAFKKGRLKTGGRNKGTTNEFTKNAREAFQMAFLEMGGIKKLTEWGKQNPSEFYRLYSKLIPVGIHVQQTTSISNEKEKSL